MLTKKLPVLLTNNFFLFPKQEGQQLTLEENSNYERKILLQAYKQSNGNLLIIPNKPKLKSTNENSDRGVLAKIILNVSPQIGPELIINSLTKIQIQGVERIKLVNREKDNEVERGEWEVLPDKKLSERKTSEIAEKFLRYYHNILEKTKITTERVPSLTPTKENISYFIDFVTQNSKEIDKLTKWRILVSSDLEERLELLITLPDRKQLDRKIEEETRNHIKNHQDEYYLREKLRVIKKKLGELGGKKGTGDNSEIQDYLEKLEKEPYPEYVKKVVKEEIRRYETMPTYSSESNITKQYIDCLMNLPWWQKSPEMNDLDFAREKLDKNHYGLTEIKKRIIEYLAVQKRTKNLMGEIICLVGPPGVGKTSLASSIAEATGRKFIHISVGGMRDVAEIRGHRRTYIGAMPGRIIQAIKKSQVANPLFLIDEIDKISSDYRGDPVHALLEILDPKQNKEFIDDYLGNDIPYDLSQVMFICTANDIWNLPRPLLDRLEIIRLYSYTEIEKFHIAKEHLIPENLEKYKLTPNEIEFQDETIKDIIKDYTRETGVRELNRKIQTIIRQSILLISEKEIEKVVVTPQSLSTLYFKKKDYEFTSKQKKARRGVATGLAWTEVGGDILLIEVNYVPGKGELILTGNLGEIMKESAQVALAYVKANHQKFQIDPEFFTKHDINIHALEGATPKEGPSAGITLTSAILSALTNQVIPGELGMTGEISLHGRIEKIGGLKEKAIAAHRSGLKEIIIPQANEKDIEDIPLEVRQELKITLAEEYEEVWKKIFITLEKKENENLKPKGKPLAQKKQERQAKISLHRSLDH